MPSDLVTEQTTRGSDHEASPRRPPPRDEDDAPAPERAEPPPRKGPRDLFFVRSDALPDNVHLLGFAGQEAISAPYRFELTVALSARDSRGFDADAALGKRASVTIQRDDGEIRWTQQGILASMELLSATDRGTLWRASLVPAFARLALGRHSRVWVDKSLQDIIQELLRKHGIAGSHYRFDLRRTYSPRPHVCQYRESDLDFVARWLEHEGIYYFFEHNDEHETLVFTDDVAGLTQLETGSIRYAPVGTGDGSAVEAFQHFTSTHTALPNRHMVRDYNYLHPAMEIVGDEDGAPGDGGEVVASFVDCLPTSGQARRAAGMRAQEQAVRRAVFQGRGRVFAARSGYRFTLADHPREALNAEYLAVELRYHADTQLPADSASGRLADAESVFSVHVQAIPAGQAYRPPRVAPKPLVDGYELAVVDGAADSDYAQIDPEGRYKLRFRFDESPRSDGSNSMWIRMAQPHTGNPEGMHFPLRKGTEVLVAFAYGDPDRPVIIAAVPDAEHRATVESANHALNVLHTGGDTRVELSDTDGKVYATVSTPPEATYLHLGAHRDATDHAGVAEHNAVASTTGTGLYRTGRSTDVTVGKVRTEEVDGTVSETFQDVHKTTVKLTVKETYKTNLTTTVAAHCQEEYGLQLTTTKKHTEEDSGSQNTKVSALLMETHGTQALTVDNTLTENSAVHISSFGPSTQTYGSLNISSGGVAIWMSGASKALTGTASLKLQSSVMCVIAGKHDSAKATHQLTSTVDVDMTAVKASAIGSSTGTIGVKIEMIQQSLAIAAFKYSKVGMSLSLCAMKNKLMSGPSLTICGMKFAPNGVDSEG